MGTMAMAAVEGRVGREGDGDGGAAAGSSRGRQRTRSKAEVGSQE